MRLIPLLLVVTSLQADTDLSLATQPVNGTQAAQSPPLVVVSWNMQWLSVAGGNKVITRTAADYAYLASIITALSPDILAFQEVDSADAIQAILPKAAYRVFMSERQNNPGERFPEQNQFTGFAVKRSLPVANPPDLGMLNLDHRKKAGKLRYGSYLIVQAEANTKLHILNVHLKSGCFSRKFPQGSKPCRTLKHQVRVLASWIRQRQYNKEDYLVVGDFNHRLNSRQQWLLTALNETLPQTIYNLTDGISASCTVNHINRNGTKEIRRYRSMVDHALSSHLLAQTVRQHGKIVQYQYSPNHIKKFQLSDHCPLVLHIPTR